MEREIELTKGFLWCFVQWILESQVARDISAGATHLEDLLTCKTELRRINISVWLA